MVAPRVAGRSLRPEWLFELVNRVQGIVACTLGSCDPFSGGFLQSFPPESELEQQLLDNLLARLKDDQIMPTGQFDPVAPSVDAPRDLTPRSAHLSISVLRAELLLRSDLAAHWTVEALARRAGCNRTDLELGFRRHYSLSMHAYLIVCRVEAAKGLLRSTAWRVEEIAKAVGCRSKVTLYEYFRRVLDMTPDNYRRRWTLVTENEAVQRLLSRLQTH